MLHCSCVGVEEQEASVIDLYHCPNCRKLHGPLQCKFNHCWLEHCIK